MAGQLGGDSLQFSGVGTIVCHGTQAPGVTGLRGSALSVVAGSNSEGGIPGHPWRETGSVFSFQG
jgi:hypothetical protein